MIKGKIKILLLCNNGVCIEGITIIQSIEVSFLILFSPVFSDKKATAERIRQKKELQPLTMVSSPPKRPRLSVPSRRGRSTAKKHTASSGRQLEPLFPQVPVPQRIFAHSKTKSSNPTASASNTSLEKTVRKTCSIIFRCKVGFIYGAHVSQIHAIHCNQAVNSD